MGLLLIILILALIFGVAGAFVHLLWVLAIILLVVWLVATLAGRRSRV